MTTTDRERIRGEADVSAEKEYQTVHRIRSRIEELEEDAALLKEHHPELHAELRDAVCGDA
ncbi:hypothetical protein [Halorubrum sp. CGM4_25_10-8A]|uniref:hypothetical protein n=1 Tax=Halorubrum sp. CGM4_25_10-8A TaxID=2518116 RepID=UPI0010F96F18|nr:hypothetical protein [Halorubrum sp. CGM4_25_10-8A]TKX40360.1 hypothetical protein EXE52_06285 [Halorubrum sp. CGM4_25_10-8A]